MNQYRVDLRCGEGVMCECGGYAGLDKSGQPEKGSRQPELGVWLPDGQPLFFNVFY